MLKYVALGKKSFYRMIKYFPIEKRITFHGLINFHRIILSEPMDITVTAISIFLYKSH